MCFARKWNNCARTDTSQDITAKMDTLSLEREGNAIGNALFQQIIADLKVKKCFIIWQNRKSYSVILYFLSLRLLSNTASGWVILECKVANIVLIRMVPFIYWPALITDYPIVSLARLIARNACAAGRNTQKARQCIGTHADAPYCSFGS